MLQTSGFSTDQLIEKLNDEETLIRYWTAATIRYVNNPSDEVIEALYQSLQDSSVYVRLAAAETLCTMNHCNLQVQETILSGLKSDEKIISLMAARIFELNKDKATDIKLEVRKIQEKICAESAGKWQGYDLYACWALNETFKK